MNCFDTRRFLPYTFPDDCMAIKGYVKTTTKLWFINLLFNLNLYSICTNNQIPKIMEDTGSVNDTKKKPGPFTTVRTQQNLQHMTTVLEHNPHNSARWHTTMKPDNNSACEPGNSIHINCKFCTNLAWLRQSHYSFIEGTEFAILVRNKLTIPWTTEQSGSTGVTRLYFFENKGNCEVRMQNISQICRCSLLLSCIVISEQDAAATPDTAWLHCISSSTALSLRLVKFYGHCLQTWWSQTSSYSSTAKKRAFGHCHNQSQSSYLLA